MIPYASILLYPAWELLIQHNLYNIPTVFLLLVHKLATTTLSPSLEVTY